MRHCEKSDWKTSLEVRSGRARGRKLPKSVWPGG